jgi:hypothetical protein
MPGSNSLDFLTAHVENFSLFIRGRRDSTIDKPNFKQHSFSSIPGQGSKKNFGFICIEFPPVTGLAASFGSVPTKSVFEKMR